MKGTVELIGMHFRARHGCLDEERRLGNEFAVDVSAEYEMEPCSKTDDLAKAVDYSVIYDLVKEEMETPSRLLENVAYRIKTRIQSAFPQLESLKVSVIKFNPPVGGETAASKVTL